MSPVYQEGQNITPYPGCPAALKCVPENYCTLGGIASDSPVELTNEFLLSRVPLTVGQGLTERSLLKFKTLYYDSLCHYFFSGLS